MVDSLRRRRSGGEHLFAYKEDGEWIEVHAPDVNAYIKAAAGNEEFSAKDFRTWSATVLTAAALAENGAADGGKQERKRAVVSAIAEAADYLGNTPAVARSAYVDPRVIDRFEHGETIADWLPPPAHLARLRAAGSRRRGRLRRTVEQAVIDLINESAATPKVGAA